MGGEDLVCILQRRLRRTAIAKAAQTGRPRFGYRANSGAWHNAIALYHERIGFGSWLCFRSVANDELNPRRTSVQQHHESSLAGY